MADGSPSADAADEDASGPRLKLEKIHSMATANLNKNEELVRNTTAASKYIPKRPRISII